jgi:3-deoxy-D-manno-octulosonic-acid transferase
MKLAYDYVIFFYQLGIRIASLFNRKAKAFVEGRKDIFKTLEKNLKTNRPKVIWVHCASLGEFEQGRPVMEMLKKDYPDCSIVLTFFSPSGYEVRKNYAEADIVCYLPWDTQANAERFVALVKPVLAIFVKYEFWYHYMHVLKSKQVPILSISAIFRPDQLFFRSYGGFYRSILHQVTHFFVQNETSLELLRSIGIEECSLAGDTRFDRVYQVARQADELPIAQRFKNNARTMVVGSCWPEDLEVVAPFVNDQLLRFIIAPHEISESFLTQIERQLKVRSIRYSKIRDEELQQYQVLIIDNIGMLNKLYRYGEFAYVGGAFGKGLHNILEAACFGIPVFFGNKNYERFREAVDLISRRGAFTVGDVGELRSKFEWLTVADNYWESSSAAKDYVIKNLGATERIVNYCKPLLSS